MNKYGMVVAGEKLNYQVTGRGWVGEVPVPMFPPQIPQSGNGTSVLRCLMTAEYPPHPNCRLDTSIPSVVHDITTYHATFAHCVMPDTAITHPCLQDLTRLSLAMPSNFCQNSERRSWVKARCTNNTAGMWTVLARDPITTNMHACFLSTIHMNEVKDGELLTQDGLRNHNALINTTNMS